MWSLSRAVGWGLGVSAPALLVLGFPFGVAGGGDGGDGAALGVAHARTCPDGMVSIQDRFCIDRYEASTVELTSARTRTVKRRHSPYVPVDGKIVKAVSIRGRVPQAHISRHEAELACHLAGKRLCTDQEWLSACKGKRPTTYPYGDDHREGYCNDRGASGMNLLYGAGAEAPQSAYTQANMNDSRLNQLTGTLAPAGSFEKCKNAYKVHDMVGNLHEWTAAPTGTFRGGYYLDTEKHGSGCDYVTTAHSPKYHDYSTGFRCCSGGKAPEPVLIGRLASGDGETKTASLEQAGASKDRTGERRPTFGKTRK